LLKSLSIATLQRFDPRCHPSRFIGSLFNDPRQALRELRSGIESKVEGQDTGEVGDVHAGLPPNRVLRGKDHLGSVFLTDPGHLWKRFLQRKGLAINRSYRCPRPLRAWPKFSREHQPSLRRSENERHGAIALIVEGVPHFYLATDLKTARWSKETPADGLHNTRLSAAVWSKHE
jgi:hypothetical protein